MQQLGYLKETPSQTAGPYVHIGLTPNFCDIAGVYDTDLGTEMINDKTLGERITVTGRIFDGAGALVRDAVVEIWQADSAGLYNSPSEMRGTADPNFTGWGRCPTRAADGVYSFETIKPGRVPFKDSRKMAPHITVWIVARGINIGLHTRVYFPEETEANGADPLLQRIEHRERVATMVAIRDGATCHFDIHLQGPKETVFLDI
ncbi:MULTISPECIES: protocatechuate 3,4-dioxygenase subunit alpha [unclassified Rhizobium]|uniref:protocatechuate 3,4-dioxygenase subunit alpha n=1 Tax=unclassified Rhizobium TaxID=2613769 RepID=UPI001A99E41C|nr:MULTISPECIES: protocatechuate 3,4-dioxygenase subunit alpha [unclassified Rhizobium]MBX5155876.1 protocatechuate 3,4-dioxygenase subunit alpha [Rhizobium sp. NZLR8]MBX5169754.1 protocatechuate 3,4-dioxygenase subunit alpha [Rhizobium sp. NZLR1b]MBX5184396.1 protocatechuate 3,4-dioxygenase subunit alpha [Rhizobium sp. NZLR5]MBX5201755.1 protocatechuate 3,4-dioxygenase subunit alpha [Rhizobium sp. NZLR1]QSZ24412.1 protocatechuate 3,4-dioxygenase subunit alpha [Rhizobium sp. NZLR1]